MVIKTVPYCNQDATWGTGLDFFNCNPGPQTAKITFRNVAGLAVKTIGLALAPYTHKKMGKNEIGIIGEFSVVLESADTIFVTALIYNKGGVSALPVYEVPGALKN